MNIISYGFILGWWGFIGLALYLIWEDWKTLGVMFNLFITIAVLGIGSLGFISLCVLLKLLRLP